MPRELYDPQVAPFMVAWNTRAPYEFPHRHNRFASSPVKNPMGCRAICETGVFPVIRRSRSGLWTRDGRGRAEFFFLPKRRLLLLLAWA